VYQFQDTFGAGAFYQNVFAVKTVK